jgi:hypothetical protein
MPLCSKCHQKEATVYVTVVVDDTVEALDLCTDCAPAMGLPTLDIKELEEFSVIGKKCEFCGKDAFSGQMCSGGGAIYWCFDCGVEFGSIVMNLRQSERPELLQRGEEASSLLSLCNDMDLKAWSVTANRKAVHMLKARRREDGRDKSN